MTATTQTATVQLIAIRGRVAIVQKDDATPVEMTWSLLHEAQDQDGPASYVYRWLMGEYCRCEFAQRQGYSWTSPRRDVQAIIAELQALDAQREATAESARKDERDRQDTEDRRRERSDEIRRVEAERKQTAADSPWWPIPSWEVPAGVRFDVSGRHQGQIVEVSYGTFGRAEAGSIDPYMHVTDRSDGSNRAYKRRTV